MMMPGSIPQRGHGQCPYIRPFILYLCPQYGLVYADAWHYKLIYFLQPSQHSLSMTANKTSNQAPQMKRSITSDKTLPSSFRFPSNYPQLPHRSPFLPLHHLLSLHTVHSHLMSVLMFSGSWPSPLLALQSVSQSTVVLQYCPNEHTSASVVYILVRTTTCRVVYRESSESQSIGIIVVGQLGNNGGERAVKGCSAKT